ncbi:MAG: RimK family alpha-L-glutamate ligase [Planctomycetaceae bacterium]|nr:RimK family alpha-L-glutamate ligase [Planctomycetaceae bacterium]MDG2388983.1 RimK family alpha-L-glutamate ligase [Planctomycetaceae bacterium]
MKIGIFGNEGSWYVDDLQRAARGLSCEAIRLDFRRLSMSVSRQGTQFFCDQLSLKDFNAFIVRTMPPGSLEEVVTRMDILGQLQAAGKLVVNSPRAIECAVDKSLTTVKLAAAGLPVPATWVGESSDDALEAFAQLGGDVVVKPVFGAEGRGIVRVSDPDLAFRTFRTLERLNAVLYLQQFVAHAGFDTRVLILDGQVVGAMKRESPDDFRTNVARNGSAQKIDPTAEQIDLALKASETIGSRIAGVDLLADADGDTFVIEVNAVPGWRAFQRATGIDVAKRFLESLEGVFSSGMSDKVVVDNR